MKQTLFAILEPDLPGARFLDLFAGSGAAGIEALSRGAAHATFVERNAGASRVIRANLTRTHLEERAAVITADVQGWLLGADAASKADPFNVVFADPPYDDAEVLRETLIRVGGIVVSGGRVVAKHHWRTVPPPVIGLLASERERRFGESSLTFYRRSEEP